MPLFRRPRPRLGDLPEDLDSRRKAIGSGEARDAQGVAGQRGPVPRPRLRVSMGVINGETIAGSKQIVPALGTREYLEFQNQSLLNDMMLNFGAGAGAKVGLLVPAGGSRIWDIKVPVNTIHVWCAVVGQAFAVSEGVAVDSGESAPESSAASPSSAAPAASSGSFLRPFG